MSEEHSMDEPALKDSHAASGQAPLFPPAEAPSCDSSPVAVETTDPEAAQRFRGHERTVQEVCSLAKEEAQARGLTLLQIEVRPAWSHEYEERTGVVIDVEIKATTDERFSYWDAVCERISQWEDSLPPEEQRFLQDQTFLVVNEG
jgi:hypothetical protein